MKSNFWRMLTFFLLTCVACAPATAPVPATVAAPSTSTQPLALATAPATSTAAPAPTHPLAPTAAPATPTLTPIGEIQPIPPGWVYLGDKKTLALGFNMRAGGSIGSLLYNGRELVDSTDYGRYVQLSYYDGGDTYAALGSDPYGNFGWNPLQAGSKTYKGAKVIEYRAAEGVVYIKAYGKEWGENDVDSDVIFETWAWLRDGYFEIRARSTHIGQDTHTLAQQEFPAAYFATSLTHEYSYLGDSPFTAQPVNNPRQVGYPHCPPVTPTENWVAFTRQNRLGLILALPSQPYLTTDWLFCLISDVAPSVGYASPIAVFDNPPNAVYEAVFYLIPGPLDVARAKVYDLLPHTTWTFDLNSLEGWQGVSDKDIIQNGIWTVHTTPGSLLKSHAGLHFPGIVSPAVTMRARALGHETNLCLSFITTGDPNWDKNESTCVTLLPGEFQTISLPMNQNEAWRNGTITQVGFTTSAAAILEIDSILVEKRGQAWEFESAGNAEGWVAWNQLSTFAIDQGLLTTRSKGDDPYLGSPSFALAAQAYPHIEIRMAVSAGNLAQVYFITASDQNYNEAKVLPFSVRADGQFHTYTLDMSTVATWVETISQIRLDPTNARGSVRIDYIRILP